MYKSTQDKRSFETLSYLTGKHEWLQHRPFPHVNCTFLNRDHWLHLEHLLVRTALKLLAWHHVDQPICYQRYGCPHTVPVAPRQAEASQRHQWLQCGPLSHVGGGGGHWNHRGQQRPLVRQKLFLKFEQRHNDLLLTCTPTCQNVISTRTQRCLILNVPGSAVCQSICECNKAVCMTGAVEHGIQRK